MKMKVLRPNGIPGPAPGILWIHGGGYMLGGTYMLGMTVAPMLAETGAVVVFPDYRLAWQSSYPAPLDDCYAALEWMFGHADELGIDRDRIVVGGESAGGGLAVALCIYARDKGEIPIALQLPLYPMLDCEDTPSSADNHGRVWNTKRNHWGWRHYLGDAYGTDSVSKYSSPARETDYAGLPPCYTFVCEGEPFYEETLSYVRNLQEAGVEASVDVYPGNVHAFDMLQPGKEQSKQARQCLMDAYQIRVDPVNVGSGFSSLGLHAPWSGLDNDTRFDAHCTAERFFFRFEVSDSTLMLTEPFTKERDVDPEDRVEIFFAADAALEQPYFCAEIDAMGRVMDYKAQFYRQFDFDWDFETLDIRSEITPWGYRVGGSVALEELRRLGLKPDQGCWIGVFQGETAPGGEMLWYSLVPTDDVSPDFHQPKVFLPCRMKPAPQRKGVVVYPDDILSLGLEEWERRIDQAGLDVIGLHAATSNDPVDTLETFIRSAAGRDFLRLCERKGVDVEYELHALETLLPRSLFESHPAFFRMDEAGARIADHNFCFTSREALEAMRPQLERLLGWMRPTTHRYYLWPDDKQHKYCHCPQCAPFSPSEQTLIFENRLLAMLREYDPEATLAHLAYHQTLPAPSQVRAQEGVFLEYAPILRDYADPLPEAELTALQDNLLAFPPATQHILEYWLDESMQARWKKAHLVPLVFDPAQVARDAALYRSLGACDVTTFATWLNGDYIARFGPTDALFRGYAAALR